MAPLFNFLAGLLAIGLATSTPLEERAAVPSNPIKVASSSFLGLRYSSNTQGVRDLGFMGNIGELVLDSLPDSVHAAY